MEQLLEKIYHLNEIGIALSAEKELKTLLERILKGAKELTCADGGSLYTVTSDNTLKFEIIQTDSLGIAMGGATGKEITFPEIPLATEQGANLSNVVSCAVVEGRVINIDDVYDAEGYDFTGTRKFDANTGYRTKSILTIPLKNHEDEIIGALQLINSCNEKGEVVAFSEESQSLAKSLASQAAVALTNQRLIDDLQHLFESFIQLIATAIDDKSPYTGSHCRRIPELTMLLAEACHEIDEGPLADFSLSDKDRYELRTAAWLHDCGKITSPEYVMDKATKLETIFDRIELIDTRFEVLKRDARIAYLESLAAGSESAETLDAAYQQKLKELDAERDFLRHANIGGEFMDEAAQERVKEIAGRKWVNPDGDETSLLNPEEVYNLTIARGTLNPEERTIINNHMVATIKMLESLPFPKHLKRVPEYAGGHHEKMDGTGYPKGLRRDEMSVPARVMAIADIFEALSARDRPYKRGKTLTECLRILGFMKKDNHIDPDIFDVFVKMRVYEKFAESFMHPEQIDEVDEKGIPGYDSAA